ncbi:MAG: molybdopterin-binding protein [Dethiobacteraceae bacterium]
MNILTKGVCRLREVPIEKAVGMVLAHDLTKIVPGEFKGSLFKKGHVIKKQDLPELLNIGKRHIYILELKQGQLHEDDAALRLAATLCGQGITVSEPTEGRVNLSATADGVFRVKKDVLFRINSLDDLAVATIHSDLAVAKGAQVAGVRAVPLVVDEDKIRQAEALAQFSGPVMEVAAYRKLAVGVVTTGSEVYHQRIADRFTPVVREKIARFPSVLLGQRVANDDKEMIQAAILELVALGSQIIIVTGGMSVDPDDRTPAAIRATGAEIVTYGTPVLPGAMLMLAYLGHVPVLGLPGCAMYNSTTVFDLILPRLFTGERLKKAHFAEMAVGGLCANCEPCRYPHCHFGKH